MLDNSTRPKLLLADDSVTIRKVVELTFADEGIDVTSVADAASAMEMFVKTQPDIVLVDVGLAGTSGYQICEMIKQDEATRHIPVLLLVGSFEPFDQDAAERAGADGFLTKPFQSIRELVARVTDLLGQDTGMPASEANEPPMEVPAETTSEEPETDLLESYDPRGVEISETADIEDLYQSSFADTVKIEDRGAPEPTLGDAGLDDELIEASYQTDGQENGEIKEREALPEFSQTKDFEWMPADEAFEAPTETAGDEAPDIRAEENSFDQPLEISVDAPVPEIPSEPENLPAAAVKTDAEVSPEFIDLIARRVVERLSDRVVREIAKDAVPRIAEKLIREALAEEKKPQ